MVNTPSAVPSGNPAHEIAAITKQKIRLRRAAKARAARNRVTAKVQSSTENRIPMTTNNQPNAAGGAPADGEPENAPESIIAPIPTYISGKNPAKEVSPAST